MKHLPAFGFLVAGLAIGILVGRSGEGTRAAGPDDGGTGTVPVRKRLAERPKSSESASLRAIRSAAPADLPALTLRSGKVVDPVEMRRLVSECLMSMTAENWEEVVSSFGRLTKETGRDLADDWRLALFRSGQLAGGDAMDTWLAAGLENRRDQSWHTLHGWGTRDPKAALEWLRNAAAEGNELSPTFYAAVIGGAAMTDPADAIRHLSDVPAALRKECVSPLVWDTASHGGPESLDPVLRYADGLDRGDPESAVFADRIFAESTEALLKMADSARDPQKACDAAALLISYGRDPYDVVRATVGKFRWYHMSDKLKIVDETLLSASQSEPAEVARMVAYLMSTMNANNGDVAVIHEWMSDHSTSALLPELKRRLPAGP